MTPKPVLSHFKFCPACGASNPSRDAEKRLHCSSCDFTLYFNPSSSAGILVFNPQGQLLVVERARPPSQGKYGIPGGFTDRGERLEEVARRETKEETNLDLKSLTFFASFPNNYHYKGVDYAVTDSYFLAEADCFENLAAEADEVTGIHFVDPKKVPDSQWAFDSLRQAVALYLKAQQED